MTDSFGFSTTSHFIAKISDVLNRADFYDKEEALQQTLELISIGINAKETFLYERTGTIVIKTEEHPNSGSHPDKQRPGQFSFSDIKFLLCDPTEKQFFAFSDWAQVDQTDRAVLKALHPGENLSLLLIPFFFKDSFEGFIGFDMPGESLPLSEAQTVNLQIFADLLVGFLERLRKERKLIESEKRFSSHIRNTPLGVISWNADFDCVLWNAAAEKIFGFSEKEALGHNALKLLVPDELHAHVDDIFKALMNKEGGEHSINENITKDGRTILCEWFNTTLEDSDGTPLGVASIVQDITVQRQLENDLKESEEVFRQFYEVIPDVFMITDIENALCVDVNDGFCNVTGYPKDEIIGKSTLEMHLWEHNEDRQKLVKSLRETGSVLNLSANFRKKDGTLWPGIMSGCIVNYKGRLCALTSTKDVSEIKKAQIDAEFANSAKSSFLSAMSHELRTPLNSILGFSQLLTLDSEIKNLSESQRQKIDLIHRSGKNMLELVNDVLDLARIESGNERNDPSLFRPCEVFEECFDLIKPLADERGITLCKHQESMNAIYVDRPKFKQILINLLGNAVKYNKESGMVNFGCRDISAGAIEIYVEDNGIGIAEEDLKSVFEPFYRANKKSTNIQGSGVGLSLVKKYLDLMDAKMRIESELGKGTAFYIHLNAYVPQSSETP